MHYVLQVEIDRPRDEVVRLFDNPENMKHWQPELLSFEPISGTPGQPGAKSSLKYQMGKREVDMVETITVRRLPDEFSGTYECSGTVNTMTNRFEEAGPGRTRWIAENTFEFGSFWMKLMAMLMPGAFKKQTRKYMQNFKAFAESNPG